MVACALALAIEVNAQPRRTISAIVAPAETLHVEVWGSGDPVVIVPGIWSSAYAFRKVIPRLTESGFKVVIVEPLGVGSSSRPARADYSMTAQAQRLGKALDSIGVREALFVGQALSTSMLMRMALQNSGRMTGLVSIEGPAVDVSSSPGLRRGLRIASIVLRIFPSPGLLRKRLKGSMEDVSGDKSWITAEVVEAYMRPWRNRIVATIDAYRAMSVATERVLISKRLSELRMPVDLLMGLAPHFGQMGSDDLAPMNALPRYTLTRIPGIGHLVHEEKPDEVVSAILRMSQRTAAKR